MTRRIRGFTLIEMMVAVFLLGLLLIITGEAVSWGLRAHRKGEASRQAAACAREILTRICSELSTAVLLPPYQPATLSGIQTDFQSSVIWPDCCTPPPNVFGNGYYARSQGNTTTSGGTSLGYDMALNRIIMTRPAKSTSDQSYNDFDFTQFVYVEYITAPPGSNGTGQNFLYRRVYPVAVAPSVIPQGVDAQPSSLETADAVFFGVDPDPTDNPNTTLANLPLLQRQQQMIVEQLPHPTDLLEFSVQHSVYSDPRGQTPPRSPAYAPSLFTITVNASVDQDGGTSYFGSCSMSQQVNIKADAQGL